jgi:hypothetical protein
MHGTARQTPSSLRASLRTTVPHRSILHPHFTRKSTAHRHPSARSTIPSATPSSRQLQPRQGSISGGSQAIATFISIALTRYAKIRGSKF